MSKPAVIWKFELMLTDNQRIAPKRGAKALTAQYQGDKLVLWMLLDPTEPDELRRVRIVGTGNPCDVEGFRYVATAQEPNRPLVWHVFVEESVNGR